MTSLACFHAAEQARKAKSSPIIYSVLVCDPTRLSVSDGYVVKQSLQAMLGMTGLPGLHYDEHGEVDQHVVSGQADAFWRALLLQIISIATDRFPGAGYRGEIAPDCLAPVDDINMTIKALRYHCPGDGDPASWDFEVYGKSVHKQCPVTRSRFG